MKLLYIDLFCGAGGTSTGVNLDWHVRAKMRYNVTRPYKHGKKY